MYALIDTYIYKLYSNGIEVTDNVIHVTVFNQLPYKSIIFEKKVILYHMTYWREGQQKAQSFLEKNPSKSKEAGRQTGNKAESGRIAHV